MSKTQQSEAYRISRRWQQLALWLGLGILIVKWIAWAMTNSNAILTDAMESIINVAASTFALYSLSLAAKPRDDNHPYGHGKIEFIAAGLEGGLILIAGLLIFSKAIYNFFQPQTLVALDVGIGVTAITGLLNYWLGQRLLHTGRRYHSLTLMADGRHLLSDAYSSLGLVLGLFLVYLTDLIWLDNVLALIFGVVILVTGYRLVRTSTAGIMDEADPGLIDTLIEDINQERSENWIDIHNFRVIKYGATLHIDCHLTLPWYFDVREAHDEVKAFEELTERCCAVPVELFIHTDPCEDELSCRLCSKSDCAHRLAEFQKRVEWHAGNVMHNQKHRLE